MKSSEDEATRHYDELDINGSRFFPGHEERVEGHRRRVEEFMRANPDDSAEAMRLKLRNEVHSRVIEMRASGMLLREIAEILDLSVMTVSKLSRLDKVRAQDRQRKRRRRQDDAA